MSTLTVIRAVLADCGTHRQARFAESLWMEAMPQVRHAKRIFDILTYKILFLMLCCSGDIWRIELFGRKRIKRVLDKHQTQFNAPKPDELPAHKAPDTLQLYHICIDYVRHENALLNHRTTWILAIQTVLGAGIGYIFTTQSTVFFQFLASSASISDISLWQFIITWLVMCGFGFLVSSNGVASIDAALYAQENIDNLWKLLTTTDTRASLPDMMGGKLDESAELGGKLAIQLVLVARVFWVVLAALLLLSLCGTLLARGIMAS